MPSYTEDSLGKLVKKDLIAITPAVDSKMSDANIKLLEEIGKLNSKFDIMQSDVLVTKVNSEFSSG